MVGSNYPPGMSSRDFVRAGIDDPHHHEHEFRGDDERANPIFEDGAAVFFEECRYVEGRHGQGWSCEETRSYRFEYDHLVLPNGHEVELPSIEDWDEVNDAIASIVITIEEAAWKNDPKEMNMKVDPDKTHGEVSIEWQGSTLVYRP